MCFYISMLQSRLISTCTIPVLLLVSVDEYVFMSGLFIKEGDVIVNVKSFSGRPSALRFFENPIYLYCYFRDSELTLVLRIQSTSLLYKTGNFN